jgi:phytoene desaturase
MAYTFQNIYVGQSPFDAPALFSMIPAAEITEGSYFPKGGMFAIIQKLITAADQMDVKFHYNSPVREITVNTNAATGIVLENGEKISSDIIVANADLPYVYRRLLPDKNLSRRIDRMKYASSAVCFHWGLDRIYPQLAHHNVFLSDEYRQGLQAIFNEKSVNDRPSFYVHAPVRTDVTAAPPGHDAISIVVGTGHLDPKKNQNWDMLIAKCRQSVIRRLQQHGLSDIEDHIGVEAVYHPGSWETSCNITRGAVFGSLAHNMMQMGYFRPHNRHKRYRNLFFVGGSTQPGNGIPNVLLSAKLTSERILNKNL